MWLAAYLHFSIAYNIVCSKIKNDFYVMCLKRSLQPLLRITLVWSYQVEKKVFKRKILADLFDKTQNTYGLTIKLLPKLLIRISSSLTGVVYFQLLPTLWRFLHARMFLIASKYGLYDERTKEICKEMTHSFDFDM